MTETADRQLVTFAVFAYNQEEYIREGIEGAFSQTYEPLEIILSDDCSSDRTFEIMQEMAAAYDGPHAVRVQRGEYNLGLADHINRVASNAKGMIVVMAAGDDVSIPRRTQRIAEVFSIDQDTKAVCSDYETIPCGQVKKSSRIPRRISLLQIVIAGGGVQKGATYAYRKDSLFWPKCLPGSIISEDRILPFRSAVLGNVRYIDESLIKYRILDYGSQSPEQRDRPVWYNYPTHVDELLRELRQAHGEGKIRYIKYITLIMCLRQSRVASLLKRKAGLSYMIGWVAFLPLKVIRRLDLKLSERIK